LPFLRFAPLACALAPLEHLFSPSPPSPFLRFARSPLPRDSNIRFPYRPRLSFSRFARTWLACPRRAPRAG